HRGPAARRGAGRDAARQLAVPSRELPEARRSGEAKSELGMFGRDTCYDSGQSERSTSDHRTSSPHYPKVQIRYVEADDDAIVRNDVGRGCGRGDGHACATATW